MILYLLIAPLSLRLLSHGEGNVGRQILDWSTLALLGAFQGAAACCCANPPKADTPLKVGQVLGITAALILMPELIGLDRWVLFPLQPLVHVLLAVATIVVARRMVIRRANVFVGSANRGSTDDPRRREQRSFRSAILAAPVIAVLGFLLFTSGGYPVQAVELPAIVFLMALVGTFYFALQWARSRSDSSDSAVVKAIGLAVVICLGWSLLGLAFLLVWCGQTRFM